MAKEKWNDMWKIMNEDRLEYDKCSKEMLCIICEKVLINAQNGPCGCRYCLKCITSYLNGEERNCPGKMNFCNDELLNLDRNVRFDPPINIMVSKLRVKCKVCEFKDELINIEDHMRVCVSQSFQCPYFNMGCNEFNFVNIDAKTHMLKEIVSHTKMSFELIDQLKNEIETLKEYKLNLEKDNENLKKCVNDLQLQQENENKEIKEKLNETENKFVEEQKCVRDLLLKYVDENKEIKEKMKEIENKLFEKENNVDEMKIEMKIMKDDAELVKKDTSDNEKCVTDLRSKSENENKEIKENINEMENILEKENVDDLKKDIKIVDDTRSFMIKDKIENETEIVTKIDELNKMITNFKSISDEKDMSISKIVNQINVLEKNQEQQNYGDFLWRIDKWREKTEHAKTKCNSQIYGDPFYSHKYGYKMCLSVCPYGSGDYWSTHLAVYCDVMLGEYDGILPWPFKHDVSFELINQHSKQIHTSCIIKYNNKNNNDYYYNKDNRKLINDDRKRICWNNKFISLKELSNNISLIDNDEIFIRCKVKIID